MWRRARVREKRARSGKLKVKLGLVHQPETSALASFPGDAASLICVSGYMCCRSRPLDPAHWRLEPVAAALCLESGQHRGQDQDDADERDDQQPDAGASSTGRQRLRRWSPSSSRRRRWWRRLRWPTRRGSPHIPSVFDPHALVFSARLGGCLRKSKRLGERRGAPERRGRSRLLLGKGQAFARRPDQVRGLPRVRRSGRRAPCYSAPFSAADRQLLGNHRCPRPSTRGSWTRW